MDSSCVEAGIPLARLSNRSSYFSRDLYDVYDISPKNRNSNKTESITHSLNTVSESSTNNNISEESNDEPVLKSSFTEPHGLNKINSVRSVVTLVLEKQAQEKRIQTAGKRKVKEFDVEKLKPFFIQFEDPVQEITELELCNNILLFIMVISGLSLVFMFGIGVAKLTSLTS